MKIKSEKGFTGTDITIALIIILLFMSMISVIFFNITKSTKNIDRNSEATYIATEIIEAVKAKNYDDVGITNGEVEVIKTENHVTYSSKSGSISLGDEITIESGYTCKINIYNYIPSKDIKENEEIDSTNDLVKVVNVSVYYNVAGETKKVELTTTLLREN